MKYELIKPINNEYTYIQQILTNRGIPFEDIDNYLNTTDECINDPFLLDNINVACFNMIKVIENKEKAIIICDSDCDGFTSAALLYNYLLNVFPTWATTYISFFIHKGKQHGLSDCCDEILKEDIQLVFCPDSASNDYEEHKRLKEHGVTVICLDHHHAEKISENAIIINNQLCDYPNKDLSGVGVTWQFCRAIDRLTERDIANKYLDLVALGNMADVMDLKSIETKHLIQKGFKSENLNNPFILAMADKNRYQLGEEITPTGAAFYIAPYVNAVMRSGTQEEKRILLESMIDQKAYKLVPSTKRGHKEGDMESIVEQATRICSNVKARQTKVQNQGLELCEKLIQEHPLLLKHKILGIPIQKGMIERNIIGLTAMKLSSKYQRPCYIICENDERNYSGSARGYTLNGINNFREKCIESGNPLFAEGHDNSFGICFKWLEDSENMIKFFDEKFKDLTNETFYHVDFIVDANELNPSMIFDICSLDNYWGKGVEEPLIAIENISYSEENFTIMSLEKNPTLKITLPCGVSLLKFKLSEEEIELLDPEQGEITINVVGKCNVNRWNGNEFPQVFIEEIEITNRTKFVF